MPRITRLRAPSAAMALGALSLTAVPAIPAAPTAHDAQSAPPARTAASPLAAAAPAADVVPQRRRLDVLAGRRASVRGAVRPADAGRPLALQRLTRRGWTTIDRARSRAGGAFVLSVRTWRPLSAPVRVRLPGGGLLRPVSERLGRLNVYRRAFVSWYGPGFYGRRLGCGGRLRVGQLGVAHKTLPCGSMVTLRHGARTVRVRVIDRGPFVGGREFDLTAATKDRLGFSGVGSILVTR